jgi:hypothetical protein
MVREALGFADRVLHDSLQLGVLLLVGVRDTNKG